MIVITGVSRGIGRFLWDKFKQENAEIIGVDKIIADDLQDNPDIYCLDITRPNELELWLEKVQEKLGKVVLINCAGINYSAFAHKSDLEKWSRVIQVNLIGTFFMIHTLLPVMREQNWGRIINFASVVAQSGVPGTTAYAASKAGLWGLSKSLAKENATKGITVNSLNLGYFDVGMIQEVPEEMQIKIKEQIPTGTFGHPDNIFNAIRFLIDSDYVNGTTIDLNAGLY
jgi:NAD(P)-dependent dehydrogenase (short-subunit alcohol dehydrogenase family)